MILAIKRTKKKLCYILDSLFMHNQRPILDIFYFTSCMINLVNSCAILQFYLVYYNQNIKDRCPIRKRINYLHVGLVV